MIFIFLERSKIFFNVHYLDRFIIYRKVENLYCKISTDYMDFPFVLKTPLETVRIITVPQLLQGVLTSLSARKTISQNMHTSYSVKFKANAWKQHGL